jgi:hypothetical protein
MEERVIDERLESSNMTQTPKTPYFGFPDTKRLVNVPKSSCSYVLLTLNEFIYYEFIASEVNKAVYCQVTECQEINKFSQTAAPCFMTVHIPIQHFW